MALVLSSASGGEGFSFFAFFVKKERVFQEGLSDVSAMNNEIGKQ
jgi:hypothetical protein